MQGGICRRSKSVSKRSGVRILVRYVPLLHLWISVLTRSDRGPPDRSGNHACRNFFHNLSPSAAQALQKVRFFTQMYWLEDGYNLSSLLQTRQFSPSQLTITIRYSDWWFWEDDEPLRMDDRWLRSFNGSPGLRELRVEYETRTPKKDEMMRIIERNRKWNLPVRRKDGGPRDWEGYLTTVNTKLSDWNWKGTSKLGGEQWRHLRHSDTSEYIVVTDVWKFVEGELSEEELGKREILEVEYEGFCDENDYDYSDNYYTDEMDDEEEDHEEGSVYGEEDSDDELSDGPPGEILDLS
jgi:hypothetical protein